MKKEQVEKIGHKTIIDYLKVQADKAKQSK